MKKRLDNITKMYSGVYEKRDINADILYLQAVHFDENGVFNIIVRPELKGNDKINRHLLQEDDLLFVAKGLNNFTVVYKRSIGKAVASSSFIVMRLRENAGDIILPEYLAWFISHDKRIKLLHQQQLGTTVPSISMKQLAKLEIDIPSLAKQETIVRLQRLREKERKIQWRLEKLKDHKIQLLLSEAITK